MHKVDALDMAHAEFRLLQKYKLQLKKVKAQIKLQTLVIEEQERLDTYCFKPRVVQMFLRVFDDLDAFMWADSSTRFLGNPETWVSHVLEDGVGFAGRLGAFGYGGEHTPRHLCLSERRPYEIQKLYGDSCHILDSEPPVGCLQDSSRALDSMRRA
jgi:hypothetical protein